jgi:hypothetical protein
LLFPDLNIWLALSISGHQHHARAWTWFNRLPESAALLFGRYTQMGFLRLLCTPAALGDAVHSLREAWAVYDEWLNDPRVFHYPEPVGVEDEFRRISSRLASRSTPKWLGDAYLMAFAGKAGATLLTFEQPLAAFSKKLGYKGEIPAP